MKRIETTIPPCQFSEVKESLINLGVEEITVAEVKGFSREPYTEIYHGAQYSIDFLPKVLIQILAPDDDAVRVAQALVGALQTGELCDSEVAITPVERLIRVRVGKC